ncbi:MAG: hypothetical protein RSB62_03125 [Bacteroides sp.]
MKKVIILLLMVVSFLPLLHAVERCDQRLSPEEFRAKQQAFITEKAALTKEEAAKFFPIYFELQDQKKQLNDEAWSLIRKGRNEDTTEAEYNKILEKVYDTRIASDQLEKSYFEKFKKILSSKKIYMVHRAEMHFHRELLKGVNRKHDGARPRK